MLTKTARFSPKASQGQVECLHLLAELARSTPRAFCELALPSLPGLVPAVVQATRCRDDGSSSTTGREKALGALAQAIVQAAVASSTVGAANSRSSTSRLLSAALLAATIRESKVHGGQQDQRACEDRASVSDLASVPAQLGESCWLPLLAAVAEPSFSLQSAVGVLREPLLSAVEAVPALVARPAVLAATIRFLGQALDRQQQAQPVASHDRTHNSADELRTVQVVASLLDSSPEMRNVVISESSGSGALMESCLVACLRCMAACPRSVILQQTVDFMDNDDYCKDEEEHDNVLYAEQLLESLVHSLGARAVQVVLAHISSHEQQRRVNAGNDGSTTTSRWCLAALRCCAWAAPVSLLPHVETAVEWAASKSGTATDSRSPFALHERCEAFMLLGALVEQYPALRERHAGRVLDLVNSTLSAVFSVTAPTPDATAWPALLIASCRVLVSLCRGGSGGRGNGHEDLLDPTLLLPYLSSLVPSLVLLLQPSSSNSLLVCVQAVSTLACLSQVVGSEFRVYYGAVMPLLLQTIVIGGSVSSSSSSLLPELRGTAMEAGSIIGKAVDDVELYSPDAFQILRIATYELQQQSQERSDNVSPDYLLAACARVSVLFQASFPF
jgi:ferredoxin